MRDYSASNRILLSVEDFRLCFHGPNGPVHAVHDVNLTVARGETVAIVGESGSGKTALCRAILMLHQQHARYEGGRIILCGHDMAKQSEKDLEHIRGDHAAMVFQDPMTSLNPVCTIGQQLMDPMRFHDPSLSEEEAYERALKLLREMEIDEPEQRILQYPHELSGGQRQRACIAIALACDPELIIADEPTTSLDPETQDHIMVLLKKLSNRGDKGILFITHDLGLARGLADKIYVMRHGHIVEWGQTEDVFRHPKADYTRALIRYAGYGKSTSHYHRNHEEEADMYREDNWLVRADHIDMGFKLGRKRTNTVLRNFSLQIQRGEILGIIGPSGCGKSTFARILMGIYQPTGGTVTYNGNVGTQMIFQDSASAFDSRMTLEQIIAEPLVIRGGMSRAERHEKVLDVLRQVHLEEDLLTRHPYDVSGGQRQRAAIARALITEPEFIVADEPISSLDVPIQAEIVHLLRELRDMHGLTIIIIAHDLPMVEHVSDRIVQMKRQENMM